MNYFKTWPKKVEEPKPVDWSQVSDQVLHEELEAAEAYQADGGDCQGDLKALRQDSFKRSHPELF